MGEGGREGEVGERGEGGEGGRRGGEGGDGLYIHPPLWDILGLYTHAPPGGMFFGFFVGL